MRMVNESTGLHSIKPAGHSPQEKLEKMEIAVKSDLKCEHEIIRW